MESNEIKTARKLKHIMQTAVANVGNWAEFGLLKPLKFPLKCNAKQPKSCLHFQTSSNLVLYGYKTVLNSTVYELKQNYWSNFSWQRDHLKSVDLR